MAFGVHFFSIVRFSLIKTTLVATANAKIVANVYPTILVLEWLTTVSTERLSEYADVPLPVDTLSAFAMTVYVTMAAPNTLSASLAGSGLLE